jgi:DHA2 family multidrug resistance protein
LAIDFKRVGLGLLFVPISTLSLSTLREKYRRRSSIYWDDAPIRWFFWYCDHHHFIARFNQEHRVNLVSHLNSAFEVQKTVATQIGFMSKGYTENEALAKAYKAIEYKGKALYCLT